MSQTAPGESYMSASRWRPVSPSWPSSISARATGAAAKSDATRTSVASHAAAASRPRRRVVVSMETVHLPFIAPGSQSLDRCAQRTASVCGIHRTTGLRSPTERCHPEQRASEGSRRSLRHRAYTDGLLHLRHDTILVSLQQETLTMRGKSAILDGPDGAFIVAEADVPDPDPNGVLVRQELCGICGTDAYVYRGGLPGVTFPIVLGHETVGVVEQLGANIHEDSTGRPLATGDRVYIQPGMSCRQCLYCVVHQQPTLCLKRRGYGFRPMKDAPPDFQGGFSQYLNLVPGSTYLKMNTDAETAVVLEPLTIGLHQVSRVSMPVGSTAVIQGAGAIGILTLVAAREAGALRTIVVGAPDSRLELAKTFGADLTISIDEVPDSAERVRMVQEETPGGYGADVVFECTGVPASLPEGLDMLRRGGTYVEAGHYTDHGDVALNPFRHMVHKQVTLVAVWGADTPHFVAGRALIESGKYPFADLVSHRLPLHRVADGVAAIGGAHPP